MQEAKETINPPSNLNILIENQLKPIEDLFIIHSEVEVDILSIFITDLRPNEKLIIIRETLEDAVLRLHLRAMKGDTNKRDHNLENPC